jgi:hypothetical protein
MEVPINTGETAAHKVFGRTANIQTVSLEGEVGVSIIETQTCHPKVVRLLQIFEKKLSRKHEKNDPLLGADTNKEQMKSVSCCVEGQTGKDIPCANKIPPVQTFDFPKPPPKRRHTINNVSCFRHFVFSCFRD